MHKLSEENELILRCLEVNPNGERARCLLAQPLDWEKITAMAEQQEIICLLYQRLKDDSLEPLTPRKYASIMQQYYFLNLQRNLIFTQELLKLTKAGNKKNIPIVALKGMALLYSVYADLGLRQMVDMDVLIKEQDFEPACALLEEGGFHMADGSLLEAGEKHDPVFSKKISQAVYMHIEVHRCLSPARPNPIVLAQLWQRLEPLKTESGQMLCLSKEDTLISLVLHLRRHTRRLTLKFIVDIALLLEQNKQTLDWDYIHRQVARNRIKNAFFFALYISAELLNAPVPDKYSRKLCPSLITRAAMRCAVNRGNFMSLGKQQGTILRIFMFDSFLGLLHYLWKALAFARKTQKRIIPKEKTAR